MSYLRRHIIFRTWNYRLFRVSAYSILCSVIRLFESININFPEIVQLSMGLKCAQLTRAYAKIFKRTRWRSLDIRSDILRIIIMSSYNSDMCIVPYQKVMFASGPKEFFAALKNSYNRTQSKDIIFVINYADFLRISTNYLNHLSILCSTRR